MTLIELEQHAALLEAQVDKMGPKKRQQLKPEISRVVASLKSRGLAIPPKLRQINRNLSDEALEEMFDNLPV